VILWLVSWLETFFHGLNVFNYLTVRALFAALFSFSLVLLFAPNIILKLKSYKIGQNIRNDGPQTHLVKAGTPTMGGIIIIGAISLSVLLWGDLTNHFLWIVWLTTLAFAAVGFIDDYYKLIKKQSKGLSAKQKFILQTLFGVGAATWLMVGASTIAETQLILPFFKQVQINLGGFFIFWVWLVVVGSSNAVNLTDGLDGLAILPIVLVTAALGVFAYLSGNILHAEYLLIPYLPGVGEIIIFCAALVGAGIGFLWFNFYPAEVFMGDVGSLSMGAAVGTIAIVVRQEFVLLIMGGLFVAETISVALQVGYYKLTKKRIFKMAPLHHHLELCGWPEPKVIVRLWIVTIILVLCGLASLKIR